jgi:thiol-disulfide isomerase/thioredoxin
VSRPARRRALLLPAVLAAVALASGCASSARVDSVSVTQVSGRMPPLSGEALDGGRVDPDVYAGRPLVVNFWATWCGPCRREQPALSSVQRSSGPDGPVFVGIDFRDDAAAARAYLSEFGVSYPSLQDASGSLAYRFDVPYLPATIFVDASGQMRYRAVGALDRRRLEELIAKISA